MLGIIEWVGGYVVVFALAYLVLRYFGMGEKSLPLALFWPFWPIVALLYLISLPVTGLHKAGQWSEARGKGRVDRKNALAGQRAVQAREDEQRLRLAEQEVDRIIQQEKL